jgi:hypothetical protein
MGRAKKAVGGRKGKDEAAGELILVHFGTAEYAAKLHRWAVDSGLVDGVATLTDIREANEPFSTLPLAELRAVLRELERQKLATVFSGSDSTSLGIKFYGH